MARPSDERQPGCARVLMYLGDTSMQCPLLEGESLRLASSPDVAVQGKDLVLPKMTLAILTR